MALATWDTTLATLPPAIQTRELSPIKQDTLAAEPYWAEMQSIDVPWKTAALARISALEIQGRDVPGLGDLRPTEEAASQLRRCINSVTLHSLPIPHVVPLSGRGIQLVWQSGARAIEVTSFADGEIVLEPLENGEINEEISADAPELLLKWLVKAPRAHEGHATAR